ncbi:hypothetical protein [Streptomyces sp. NBC_01363]|uniref:hypothetical protein n=1 Tax=Streptomyces sp. NBC_01363 TaxID=2903840 RepID=UPI00224D0A2C|nr:hypothetical protein [Streptomyces sp. NBC_01363]MCX4732720.1 hypothetical protein [Streptomyces sp. NBC_01363]
MSRATGAWGTRAKWAVGGLGAAVVLLTGYALLSGDGGGPAGGTGGNAAASSSATPSPGYQAPEGWTEPDRWAALPRGARTDGHGSNIGFPHTTEGAAAMLAATNSTAVDSNRTTVDEQLRLYYSYVGKSDQSDQAAERIELAAGDTDKSLAREMSVPAGQPLPPGAYVRSTVVGYKVIKASADQAGVWLLSRVTQKNGETAKEAASYTRTLVGAQWENGDWKLTAAATTQAQQDAQAQSEPKMVAPGDAAFNAAGWTAIREAS